SDSNCNGSANTSSASSPNCAYSTLSKAASIAIAGDNVSIQAGTYKENVAFSNSGTSSTPITFTGKGSPVIAGNVITKGSYLTIDSLTFSPPTANAGGVFYNNYAVYIYGTHTLFNNCLVTNYGALASDQATAFGFDSGSSYNTIQNSSIINLNDIDVFHVFGHDQKILHNIVNNIQTVNYAANHTDFVQTWGWTGSLAYNILVDSNRVINGSEQIGVVESDSIPGVHDWTFSNNVFANITGSLFVSTPNVHLYNNIFYQSGANGYSISFYGGSEGLALENNAFIINTATQGLYAQGWNYNALPPAVSTISNNYYGSTTYASISQNVLGSDYKNGGNPAFVNAEALNFNIQAGSVFIGSGVNLSSLFTNDMTGNLRGATWDIGPYMYTASGTVALLPPSKLRVTP
ncbi:MAG: hypothetical protein ACXVB1_10760, partial [Pseudobdellovibrionaceae bacterium]